MSKIIGIDLGTTNSVVAVMEASSPRVLANDEGKRTTPSVVAFTKGGERLVGQLAKRQATTNPENTIYSAKRFIGRNFSDMRTSLSSFPYKIVEKDKGCAFELKDGKVITPEEIASAVLGKLKTVAETYLGHPVSAAVVTVPAYFNNAQRQATKDAGRIAGLEVKRIINEPTAAALSYGLDKRQDGRIAVFDFGGGTFDISILEVSDKVTAVLASNGDTYLGGDDFDQKILDWMLAEFKKEHGIDLTLDKMAVQRLKETAETVKIELSKLEETQINLPFITADASGPKHLSLSLSRAKLESMCADLVDRAMEPCRQVLQDADLQVSDIDEVVLVGGTTHMPLVRRKVEEFFKRTPNQSVNPEEVVACGAAVQGGIISGSVKDLLLLDVTPLGLGIETLGGVCTKIIPRNTTVPVKKSQMFSTAADNQTSVSVHVLEGEREMASDNRTLGRFELMDIPAAPRGAPQIAVSFDIDVNGILNVSAKDQKTDKSQSIKIATRSGLSKEEVEHLVEEAKRHAADDAQKKEMAGMKNELEAVIYQSEGILNKHRAKMAKSDADALDKAILEAREALQKGEKEAVSKANESLVKLNQTLSSKLYHSAEGEEAKAQGGGGTPNGAFGGKKEGATTGSGVVDVDFKEENKKEQKPGSSSNAP